MNKNERSGRTTRFFGRNTRRLFRCGYKWGGLGIAAIGFIIILPICRTGFATWDLELFSTRSPVPFGLQWNGLIASITLTAPWDGAYGPLCMLSHMADFRLFRFEPFSHHLTNLWLHCFNIALMFAVSHRLGRSAWTAPFDAGLLVIPEIAVIPAKRIWSGDITPEKLLHVVTNYRPELILVAARPLPLESEVRKLVEKDYALVARDKKRLLYAVRESKDPIRDSAPPKPSG